MNGGGGERKQASRGEISDTPPSVTIFPAHENGDAPAATSPTAAVAREENWSCLSTAHNLTTYPHPTRTCPGRRGDSPAPTEAGGNGTAARGAEVRRRAWPGARRGSSPGCRRPPAGRWLSPGTRSGRAAAALVASPAGAARVRWPPETRQRRDGRSKEAGVSEWDCSSGRVVLPGKDNSDSSAPGR